MKKLILILILTLGLTSCEPDEPVGCGYVTGATIEPDMNGGEHYVLYVDGHKQYTTYSTWIATCPGQYICF